MHLVVPDTLRYVIYKLLHTYSISLCQHPALTMKDRQWLDVALVSVSGTKWPQPHCCDGYGFKMAQEVPVGRTA